MEIEKEFRVIEVESTQEIETLHGCCPSGVIRYNIIPVSKEEIASLLDFSFSRKEK